MKQGMEAVGFITRSSRKQLATAFSFLFFFNHSGFQLWNGAEKSGIDD